MIRIRRLRLAARRAGTTAIETAIVLPVVLLFIVGLMEFGRAIWIQATLDYAVESAARCAAINTTQCATASQTQAYAAGKAAGLTLATSVFTLTTQTCGAQVSASLPFQFVVPILFPYAITLTAAACYPT